MAPIGPCSFRELPPYYQEQFKNGTIADADGQFFAFEASDSAVPGAVIMGLTNLLPAVGIILVGAYYLARNPAYIGRVFGDMFSGIGPFIMVVGLMLLLFFSLFVMLRSGWGSITEARIWWMMRRAPEGVHHYGMLIDDENLVLRHGNRLVPPTCAIFPRDSIKTCFASTVRSEGPKNYYDIPVVKLHYYAQKSDELPTEFVLRLFYGLSAEKTATLIKKWLPDQDR